MRGFQGTGTMLFFCLLASVGGKGPARFPGAILGLNKRQRHLFPCFQPPLKEDTLEMGCRGPCRLRCPYLGRGWAAAYPAGEAPCHLPRSSGVAQAAIWRTPGHKPGSGSALSRGSLQTASDPRATGTPLATVCCSDLVASVGFCVTRGHDLPPPPK